jgi:hypothetical protein
MKTFDTIPFYIVQTFGEANLREGTKWSGKNPPPAIGSKVAANFNNLGRGTVTGYFEEGGWLGVLVQLDNPPSWYVKQNNGNVIAHIFGAELDWNHIGS